MAQKEGGDMGKCAVPYPRGVRRPGYLKPIYDDMRRGLTEKEKRLGLQWPQYLYKYTLFDVHRKALEWGAHVTEEFAKTYCDAIGSTIRVLSLAPDDIVIVQYPGKLSDKALERLVESVGRYFPNKIMVLEEGMTIGVVTAKEKAEVDG